MAKAVRAPFEIAGRRVAPGETAQVTLPAARLYTDTPIDIVVEVVHGKLDGPVLLVCAALHGDEINGVEVCRRLVHHPALVRLRGTLLIVPIVNSFGFIQQSRYLPDRRDLNRCFPGSARGALGSRLAHLFRTEVLARATHAIDLHTGAIHRDNLAQVRTDVDDPRCAAMARVFGAPIIIDAKLRDGSLRETAGELGIPLILYEAGEALRFSETAIKAGVRGILGVMRHLEMFPPRKAERAAREVVVARRTYWVRSEGNGMVLRHVKLGERVAKGQVLAHLVSPYGREGAPVKARWEGIVVGMARIPLVNEGEALFHIAQFDRPARAHEVVEEFQEHIDEIPEPEPFRAPD